MSGSTHMPDCHAGWVCQPAQECDCSICTARCATPKRLTTIRHCVAVAVARLYGEAKAPTQLPLINDAREL